MANPKFPVVIDDYVILEEFPVQRDEGEVEYVTGFNIGPFSVGFDSPEDAEPFSGKVVRTTIEIVDG